MRFGAFGSDLDAINPARPGWDDLRVALSTANLPAVSDPTYAAFRPGVYAMRFAPNQDNVVAFETQIPHSWEIGTDLEPHVHWASATPNVTGTVIWRLTYTIVNRGGVFAAPVSVDGTFTFDGSEAQYQHHVTGLGVIPGAEVGMSAVLLGTLARMASLDTYTDPVFGLSFDLHFRQDAMGSDTQYVKEPPA